MLKYSVNHNRNHLLGSRFGAGSQLRRRHPHFMDWKRDYRAADQKVEKQIERRERSTLLFIIAALSKLIKIDMTKHTGAPVAIENETIRMAARIAARTIEDHLKRISHARGTQQVAAPHLR